jgi:hypothetical protein
MNTAIASIERHAVKFTLLSCISALRVDEPRPGRNHRRPFSQRHVLPRFQASAALLHAIAAALLTRSDVRHR